MEYEIIALGRARWSGKVRGTERELFREIRRHLVSDKSIDIDWNGDDGRIYAGVRHVGDVKRRKAEA